MIVRRRQTAFAGWLGVVFVLMGGLSFSSAASAQGECPPFAPGSNPPVFLNWTTFKNRGIADTWKPKFIQIIKDSLSRWEQGAAVKLHPFYAGETEVTDQNAQPGLLIKMTDSGNGNLATSTGGGPCNGDRNGINFHSHNVYPTSPWPWTTAYTENHPTYYDFYAVMMHEMGHAVFGLLHEPIGDTRKMMSATYDWDSTRFGPTKEAADRAQTMFGAEDRNRIKFYKFNANADDFMWADQLTNIDTYPISTTYDPDAGRDGLNHIFAYSDPSHGVCWISGVDASGTITFTNTNWVCYSSKKSYYGVGLNAVHDGAATNAMYTYVDRADNNNNLRVLFSSNWSASGTTWTHREPVARAVGTPDIVNVSGGVWALVYPILDLANNANTGKVALRLTPDKGQSWCSEQVIGSTRSSAGVSVAVEKIGAARRIYVTYPQGNISATGFDTIRTVRRDWTLGCTTTAVDDFDSNMTGFRANLAGSDNTGVSPETYVHLARVTPYSWMWFRRWDGSTWAFVQTPASTPVTTPAFSGNPADYGVFGYAPFRP